jgi:hypothetical protein
MFQTGVNVMEKTALTVDERLALRMWCRQALAKLEQEELKDRLLAMRANEETPAHRVSKVRKRPSRVANTRVKELVH